MSRRVCLVVGCPAFATSRGRCGEHAAELERQRGTAKARGYGRAHRGLRAQWLPVVATGMVLCARCGRVIDVGAAWDLGHTDDRRGWSGPEHAGCNRRAPRRRETETETRKGGG